MAGIEARYIMLEKATESNFCRVYRAEHRESGEQVAIRREIADSEEGIPSTALREIAFLKELRHPNIVL